jgi:hypothetical protein
MPIATAVSQAREGPVLPMLQRAPGDFVVRQGEGRGEDLHDLACARAMIVQGSHVAGISVSPYRLYTLS